VVVPRPAREGDALELERLLESSHCGQPGLLVLVVLGDVGHELKVAGGALESAGYPDLAENGLVGLENG